MGIQTPAESGNVKPAQAVPNVSGPRALAHGDAQRRYHAMGGAHLRRLVRRGAANSPPPRPMRMRAFAATSPGMRHGLLGLASGMACARATIGQRAGALRRLHFLLNNKVVGPRGAAHERAGLDALGREDVLELKICQ